MGWQPYRNHLLMFSIILFIIQNSNVEPTAQNNQSTVLTSPNGTICDSAQGITTEGTNATLQYGICRDAISVPIISGAILFFYMIMFVVCVVGLIWKRKSGHIAARSVTVITSFLFVVLTCLRFIISRKLFPCFLYSINFFILPPCFCLPSIMRCLRMFLMHKVNSEKTHIYKRQLFGVPQVI